MRLMSPAGIVTVFPSNGRSKRNIARKSRTRTKSPRRNSAPNAAPMPTNGRSEEHTSELQSLMRISYAVYCFKKKNIQHIARLLYNARCRMLTNKRLKAQLTEYKQSYVHDIA